MNEPITVLVERCTMQINTDAFFTTASLARQKKLLGYVFQEPWRNEKTIDTLSTYLPQKQAEAKEAWAEASVDYTNGYVDTSFRWGLRTKEKQAIERENKRLLAAVKRAKAKHEKYQKILTAFEAVKNKTPNEI